MKNYEKQSFITTFFLFFLTLFIFTSLGIYFYYQDRLSQMDQSILHQMKEYTFDFRGDKFTLDFVQKEKGYELYTIYNCKEGKCAYFQIPTAGPYLLKVIFAQKKVSILNKKLQIEVLKILGVSFILILGIAFGFAVYSIRPMRNALRLLEEFLKDLIHDLNTPATAILLNTKLLRRRGNFEETDRIDLSANTIASLHKNLQFLQMEKIEINEEVSVDILIHSQIDLIKKLYPRINFITKIEPLKIQSNQNALTRIVDNILTNACKYNRRNGKVYVTLENKKLTIEDTGIGIQDTKRVFERYYKENARGLGIGLSIVKQLCEVLKLPISLTSQYGVGTKVVLTLD